MSERTDYERIMDPDDELTADAINPVGEGLLDGKRVRKHPLAGFERLDEAHLPTPPDPRDVTAQQESDGVLPPADERKGARKVRTPDDELYVPGGRA